MGLHPQTVGLLQAARQLAAAVSAEAVLVVTDTVLDWADLRALLDPLKPIVASHVPYVVGKLAETDAVPYLELDFEPVPMQERLSQALLRAVADELLKPGEHVLVLYNGIAEMGRNDPVDSLSIIHLGEHLDRLTAHDLRKLDTRVPLETLRLVVDLATEIGREGREGKPVGTLLVVGDTRKVLAKARPINFNPFRGYSREERDLRYRKVREQIKDIAQLDGALIIGRDGVAVAACMFLDVTAEDIVLSPGLGARHMTAAAVSARTNAISVVVSQSTGTVRLFQHGRTVLHIEPLLRPHIWQPLTLDTSTAINGESADD